MTKQQTIETLQKQLPGFYSVEQVIKMINDIEDSESTGILTEQQIIDLADQIASGIVDDGMDLVYIVTGKFKIDIIANHGLNISR